MTITTPVTFMLGQNGAGKTTLFRAILGEVRPTSGTIDVDRNHIGYCPQMFNVPSRSTVVRYLVYVGWLKGMSRTEALVSANTVMSRLKLNEWSESRPSRLSGGLLRRLGIAQALLSDPALLLLDEPTANLDPLARLDVLDAIASASEHSTVLVSTHQVADVDVGSPDLLILKKGELVFNDGKKRLADSATVKASSDATASLHRMITDML